MLTKNFPSIYKAMKWIFDNPNGRSNYCENYIRNLTGEASRTRYATIACSSGFASTDNITLPEKVSCCILAIGSGNTPATADDYELENEITEGFEVISQATHYSGVLSSSYVTITRTIKNTTNEPLVINEIGLKVQGYYPEQGDTTQFLAAREVLEKQCVISGGGKALLYNQLVRGITDFAHNIIAAFGSRLEVA